MKLTMQLKSRSYDIILKAGCLANLHQFINVQGRKVFVLTDDGVPAQYAQTVADQCTDAVIYTIPQGEASKCLKVYGQVLQAMLDFGMDRGDLLVEVKVLTPTRVSDKQAELLREFERLESESPLDKIKNLGKKLSKKMGLD